MAIVYSSITREPAATGPDVVFCPEAGDFDAFANGLYISSHANSQEAWAAARRAVFAPPADDTAELAASFAEQEARAVAPSPCVAPVPSVTLTRDAVDAGTPDAYTHLTYQSGAVLISVDADDPNDMCIELPAHEDVSTLRSLWAILSHPEMQRRMFGVPPIVERVELHDDPLNPRHGQPMGTMVACGADSAGYETEVYFPLAPDDNPYNVPVLFALGEGGWSLEEVDRVLPQIIALMSSPEVQAARARWAAQQAPAARRAA